jgi:hypothetical protein
MPARYPLRMREGVNDTPAGEATVDTPAIRRFSLIQHHPTHSTGFPVQLPSEGLPKSNRYPGHDADVKHVSGAIALSLWNQVKFWHGYAEKENVGEKVPGSDSEMDRCS